MVHLSETEQARPHVLIVDDEDSIRDSLEIILGEAGYDVASAADAQGAVDLLQSSVFDVAIVDRILPGRLDGVHVIREIKKANPQCETVLMSAYPSFESAAKLLEHETCAYLTKPIQQQEICAVVAEAVRKNRAKLERKRSEAILQGVFDASPNPIIIYDPQGRIRFVNPAFTALFGYGREEVLGSVMFLVPDADASRLQDEFQRLLAGTAVPEREQVMLHRDGSRIQTSRIVSVCRDLSVNGAHILVIIRDITDSKKMQAQILQSEKLAMLGELAAKLAHEINNPLQIISGQAELLLRAGMDEDNAMQVSMMEQAAHKIEKLTSSLMFVARPKPERITCFAPEGPLEKAADFLMSMGQTKYIAVKRRYECNQACVEGDAGQFEQVFMNLIVNAAHAVAGSADPSITLSTRIDQERGRVFVSVADTGCGIESSVRQKIFDPFFTTREGDKGNGLGLSVVKQIVERHGGSIDVASEPGRGSVFTVSLPMTHASDAQADTAAVQAAGIHSTTAQEKSA